MNNGIEKKNVIAALKQCYDPEIPVNVYDLGLIYDITIKEKTVKIVMTLTSPFCPVTDYMIEDIKNKIKELSSADAVDLQITFDPPWNKSRMTEEAKAQLGL
jgi:FeS assembly SUF system protein